MLRKLFNVVGHGAAAPSAPVAPSYAPYSNDAANGIYNLLFCDEPDAFRPRPGQTPVDWQVALFAEPVDASALLALAGDVMQEGRVRYLAYAALRRQGQPVPPKQLFGVIVEVPLDGGLDVLAAYSEGGVRYINQTGHLAIFEGAESLRPLVQNLFTASEPVVALIGPWDQPRMPPPEPGNVRLSFLVSDGLYFGQGPMSVMQGEPMGGPIIQRAVELLQAVVAMSQKSEG